MTVRAEKTPVGVWTELRLWPFLLAGSVEAVKTQLRDFFPLGLFFAGIK